MERLRKYLPELYGSYRLTFPRFTQRPLEYVLVGSRITPFVLAVYGGPGFADNVQTVILRSLDGKISWAAYEEEGKPFVYSGRYIMEITSFDLAPALLERETVRKEHLRRLLAPVLAQNLIGYLLRAY